MISLEKMKTLNYKLMLWRLLKNDDPFSLSFFPAAWACCFSFPSLIALTRCYGPANQPDSNRVTGLLSDQQASSALVGNFWWRR